MTIFQDVIRSTPDDPQSTVLRDSLDMALQEISRLQAAESQSLEILEKTNQQLSLWWNPYGFVVAIFGFLFWGMMAIAAVMVIRRPGSVGYFFWRELKNRVLRKRDFLERLVGDARKEIREGLDQEVTDLKDELKTAKEEDKEEIEK